MIENYETKVVKGYELYAASKCGEVFRISTGKKMAKRKTKTHNYVSYYTRICINNKAMNRKTHRLVALAWLGDPPSELHTQINHKDGNPLNNHVDNLEWCTPSQNQRHAVDSGLKGKGDELYNATLSESQVHEICVKLKDGARAKDLSDYYGVSTDIIRKIRAGDTYFHIRQLYDIDHKYQYDYSESTVKWVCSKILEGLSDKGIVKVSTNPNLTIIEIKRIRYKIRYKWISDSFF